MFTQIRSVLIIYLHKLDLPITTFPKNATICKFCFHTQKNTFKLSLDEAKKGLKLLKDASTEKVNFAGGEPFLIDVMLGELCRYSSVDLGMTVSIISIKS